jgi:hypothetical protein
MPLCGRSERIKHLKARLVRGAGSYTRQTQFYFRRRCLSGLEMITAFSPGQGECHAKRKGQSAGARGKRQSTSLGTTTLARVETCEASLSRQYFVQQPMYE